MASRATWKDMLEELKPYLKSGWTMTEGEHPKIYSPDGVFRLRTTRSQCRGRAVANFKAELKRAVKQYQDGIKQEEPVMTIEQKLHFKVTAFGKDIAAGYATVKFDPFDPKNNQRLVDTVKYALYHRCGLATDCGVYSLPIGFGSHRNIELFLLAGDDEFYSICMIDVTTDGPYQIDKKAPDSVYSRFAHIYKGAYIDYGKVAADEIRRSPGIHNAIKNGLLKLEVPSGPEIMKRVKEVREEKNETLQEEKKPELMPEQVCVKESDPVEPVIAGKAAEIELLSVRIYYDADKHLIVKAVCSNAVSEDIGLAIIKKLSGL